jgi:cytochrome c oxidase subunit 2
MVLYIPRRALRRIASELFEIVPPRAIQATLPWFALALALTQASACGGGIEPGEVPIDSVAVRVLAQDVSWSGSYLLPAGAGTREIPTGREVHLPLGADVRLTLQSRDYICLFNMPGLSLRDFASPGLAGSFHFRATQKGSFPFNGDELCGLPHGEKTRGQFIVEEPAEFQAWVHAQSKKASR